jgi:hypothetical protein
MFLLFSHVNINGILLLLKQNNISISIVVSNLTIRKIMDISCFNQYREENDREVPVGITDKIARFVFIM